MVENNPPLSDESLTERPPSDFVKNENLDNKSRDDVFKFIVSTPDSVSDKLKNIVGKHTVNFKDDSGMSMLMHAAWKRKYRIVKYLIEQGADINERSEKQDYTALHFAALAGCPKMCRLLVESGAKTDIENCVKRTPSQMAAFVGNSDCATMINNFVSIDSISYYSIRQPLEESPKLDPTLVKPLHDLVLLMNVHPVRICLHFVKNCELLKSLNRITHVLEMMRDRAFKQEVNEILAMKYHVMHFVLCDASKQLDIYANKKEEVSECDNAVIDDSKEDKSTDKGEMLRSHMTRYMRYLLKKKNVAAATSSSDKRPRRVENLIRQSIKTFPFMESQVFKMLVANFAHCNESKGVEDYIEAYEYVNQMLNGQNGTKSLSGSNDGELYTCITCGNASEDMKACAKCLKTRYCDATCQKVHWTIHKNFCTGNDKSLAS